MRYIYCFMIISMLFATFAAGCAGPSGSLLMRKQLKQYGVADQDIPAFQRGKELAAMECAGCHRFFLPREYSPEEWEGIIRNQAKRLSLDKQQIADIKLYFQVASGLQR